ncbi:MAG: ParA family protein [Pseudomonadales bacterium]
MIRVVFNQKGGVGKSSLATNLAAISAQRGVNTLVVDLDPQCNTTQYLLGEDVERVEETIRDLFTQNKRASRIAKEGVSYIVATPYEHLDLIAADAEIADLQAKLEAKHKIYKLRDALRAMGDYDEIYIDTPPAFNIFTMSALIAADRCLIPFDCDDFSRRALYTLLENVEETQEDHNPELVVDGIVVNQFQVRAHLPQSIVEELHEEGLPLLDTMISQSVKMRESHSASQPLIHFAPSHKITQELIALYDELHCAKSTARRREWLASA